MIASSQIGSLLDLSSRIGNESLLVQAGTGNTSVKLDGVLWIKASGKWLAHARDEEILIPVSLDETLRRIEQNIDPAGQTALVGGKLLGTSVETAMHAVLPHPVVLHVHSVNTIAYAVRLDGEARLAELFEGLRWAWIPYVQSGLPLARAIRHALERNPQTDVLVLANHGLVVAGDSCESAEALLREVERRVATTPRFAPEPAWEEINRIAASAGMRAPQNTVIHSLGTDAAACRAVTQGILYPCQAIFLTPQARSLPASTAAADLPALNEPFVLIQDCGALVRQKLNATEFATLNGLVQVLLRIPEDAPIRYLTADEVSELLCADVYHYREMVEGNGAARLAFRSLSPTETAVDLRP